MALIDAELFMQAADWDDSRRALVEQALHDIPGVEFVSPPGTADPSVEARVQIAFDPQITNPVVIKQVLARQGFTVLSSRESDTCTATGSGTGRGRCPTR